MLYNRTIELKLWCECSVIVYFCSDGCSDLLEIQVSVPECARGATAAGGTVSPAPLAEETAAPTPSGAGAECKASSATPSQLVTPEAETSTATPSELVVAETKSNLSAPGSAKAKKGKGKKASKTILPA